MKFSLALVVAAVAALAISVRAQDPALAIVEKWPYCPCIPESAYSISKVTSKPNNIYCFTVVVKPPLGCTSKCCTSIDLKKLEINTKPECRVSGLSLKGWINGKPAPTNPVIERSALGPNGTYILKQTQLGLNLTTANNAEICIQLDTNRQGQGCDTLVELCVPPAGSPPGVCQTALFDSQNDCCGLTDLPKYSPPPPKYSPPPPKPVPCEACTYINLIPPSFDPMNTRFDSKSCSDLGNFIVNEITTAAASVGSVITKPFAVVTCQPLYIKICGEFASAADGAKLQGAVDDAIAFWLSIISPTGNCPPYFYGYSISIIVGGNGPNPLLPPSSCLSGSGSTSCNPGKIDFPKCKCTTKAYATPFALSPFIATGPGSNANFTSYCFITEVVTPVNPTGKCASQNILSKVEFYANDLTRRKINNFYVKAAGAADFKVVAPSWGAYGEQTLKCTGLDWTEAQAAGGLICMELKTGTDLGAFCLGNDGGSKYCWANIFNPDKECCPVYTAALV